MVLSLLKMGVLVLLGSNIVLVGVFVGIILICIFVLSEKCGNRYFRNLVLVSLVGVLRLKNCVVFVGCIRLGINNSLR